MYHPKVFLGEILNGPALSVFNLRKGNDGILDLKKRQKKGAGIIENAGIKFKEIALLL